MDVNWDGPDSFLLFISLDDGTEIGNIDASEATALRDRLTELLAEKPEALAWALDKN